MYKRSCITIYLEESEHNKSEGSQPLCKKVPAFTYPYQFSCEWAFDHMCVIMMPHLSSPTASQQLPGGWKRVKPQTSGAPEPIRIVYLASHDRLAEREHAASHTARLWNLSPHSLFFHSFKLFWLPFLPRSHFPVPSFWDSYYPASRCNLSEMFQVLSLIILINKLEIFWFVRPMVSLFV